MACDTMRPSAEPGAGQAHPCPMSGAFARCCNSSRKIGRNEIAHSTVKCNGQISGRRGLAQATIEIVDAIARLTGHDDVGDGGHRLLQRLRHGGVVEPFELARADKPRLPENFRMYSSSRARKSGLTLLAIAPMRSSATKTIGNAIRFGSWTVTTSLRPMPIRRRNSAQRSTLSFSSP